MFGPAGGGGASLTLVSDGGRAGVWSVDVSARHLHDPAPPSLLHSETHTNNLHMPPVLKRRCSTAAPHTTRLSSLKESLGRLLGQILTRTRERGEKNNV